MIFRVHNLLVLLLAGHFAIANETVTPEERKAEFAKPRGFSQSTSSAPSGAASSSSTSGAAQPSPVTASVTDVYSKMGDSFSKEINTLSKNFSLPKIKDEPNYLEELEKASKSLDSASTADGRSSSSLITQYTDAFISTLFELTQMQIQYELSKMNRKAVAPKAPLKNHDPSEQKSISPSPISLRTRISATQGYGKGLFPSEIDNLNAKAYNPPK
jgi:hypothetical protein